MKFQEALEEAPEHVIHTAETKEGWLAIQVAGQWFSVHGSAVTAYEGAVESRPLIPQDETAQVDEKTGQPED